jgi:hypothetical protein
MTIEKPADLTSAWSEAGGGGAPTTIHEPASGADIALAYSEAIEIPEPARSRVPVVLFTVAAVALAGALAGLFLIEPTPPTAPVPAPGVQSAQELPSIQGEPPAAEPTPNTAVAQALPDTAERLQPPDTAPAEEPPGAVPDADDVYIHRLITGGLVIYSRDAVIATGHKVCLALEQGHSSSVIVSAIATENPTTMGPTGAAVIVAAAIASYCPQFN